MFIHPLDDPRHRVHDDHSSEKSVQQLTLQGFTLQQGLLGLLALGDIRNEALYEQETPCPVIGPPTSLP